MREEDWIPSVDEICAAFHSAVGTKDDAFTQIRKLIVNCYTYRDGAPAPVRDAAESEPLNVWDQCDALRARVAGLEGTISELRESNLRLAGEVGTECGNLKNALEDRDAARALLAVERERVIEECAKACDAFAEEDRGTSQCVGASLCADRIRALAQPRAERETKDV